jgi:AraC family transcriptional activator of tynA and feaB
MLHVERAAERTFTQVYSSAELSYNKRGGWQEIVNGLYANLNMRLVDDARFNGEIRRASLSRVDITNFVTDGEIACRQKQHIARDEEDFFLFDLSCAGTSTYEQYNRKCDLPPNHYTLLYTASPYSFSHRERVNALCVKIPSAALESRVGDPHSLCGIAKPIVSGLSRVTADLLISIVSHAGHFSSDASYTLEGNVLDLIGLVLAADQSKVALRGSSVRWAIHRRAVTYIKESLGNSSLNPEIIASAVGVSVRYLHRVFEDAEESVAETLARLRLEKARVELADPRLLPCSIKEIAFRNGFKTQSHFASAFRARFGATPKEIRHLRPIDRST